MEKISVVIPAAGAGRRLKSYGPKALLSIGQETVIQRQLRLLRHTYDDEIGEIIVVGGFYFDRMKRKLPKEVKLVLNKNYETTNVAKSIEIGLRAAKSNKALVVFGDLVFNSVALPYILPAYSKIVVENSPERSSEVGVNIINEKAIGFSYGLPTRWAQIVLLCKKEKELFIKEASKSGREKLFAYEVLNEVIDKGGEFKIHNEEEAFVAEIDCSKDIEFATTMAKIKEEVPI